MSDIDQKKDTNSLEPDANGINLLPESLRQAEDKEIMAKDGHQVELRVPKLDKKKLPEGKVPWFSFASWFGRDKKSKAEEAEPAMDTTPAKPKLVFKILKSKEAQEAEEREKEESWKQEIIKDVFAKKGDSLPENDNALFNQEHAISAPELPQTPPTPNVTYEAVNNPVTPIPATPPPMPPAPDMSLPQAPQEPVIPPVPSIPATPPMPVTHDAAPEEHHGHGGLHLPHWKLGKQSEPKVDAAADGFQVNLMPTAMTLKTWSQISQQLAASGVGALVLIGLIYGGLIFWSFQIEQRAKAIDQQIATVEASIGQFQGLKDQISQTETQIKDVQQLLNRHIYWTHFFDLLQKYTIDTVYFDKFAAGINGSLSLSAHGNDYQAAARQLKLLQTDAAKEFVKNASITSVTKNTEGGVSFNVGLTLNNELFYYASTTPSN
jgi:Tfp pilus assembly protein PilN